MDGMTAHEDGLAAVARLLGGGGVAVLSGAGLSTESGIPDYRGPDGIRRHRAPMTYQEFLAGEPARRRYWARSHAGRAVIAGARPNAGHYAVARLRDSGRISAVITQNVDGLHRAAGTADAVELHGGLDRVICLGCAAVSPRTELDERLAALNPAFRDAGSRINPDGDVEVPDDLVESFAVADCARCGGVLKPDVVFFGESVPRDRVDHCYRLVDEAEALLVLGSSLAVMSGLRFVRHAAKTGKPVAIITRGTTRGDDLATTRLDRPLGETLTALADLLAA
ncbi:NAD-dependent protein deacetylase [Kitasatospora cheerisanensis]|uniref:NAD-dependent protein deacetylase n=1 Tax=Kitasatospora cheerisanensis KCTC 2395 TaxID=1348663 RepID=A0A066Z309_9ACTN|nr:NAD-dependent protein deacetylase [Kitasatospora cheerisanensis]KDN84565.1 NAD-dependent deacetylase [Kitasatospora cheerisanensis KCTC 2395]